MLERSTRQTFEHRFKSYLYEHKKPKPREHVLYMIDRWKSFLWFYYSPIPAGVPVSPIEDKLLTAFLPPVNREWPAEIRDEMEVGILMSSRNRIFPALRCRMGTTIYYASFMSFADVTAWVKPTTEIHKSRKLSNWIQRQLIRGHSEKIADYLLSQDERFFNAIVVGIYGGEPTWAPLRVSAPVGVAPIRLTDEQEEHLESSIGILTFSGDEQLFAIDGQHRVAGIKAAVAEPNNDVRGDEIIALFVGHKKSKRGEQRTRRLFTTLNKTARRVSDADRVALDEDDGFAIVTRRLVDEFELFDRGKPIAFAPTASLPTNDDKSVSTIISLYSQVKDLYSSQITSQQIKKTHFGRARPDDEALDEVYNCVCRYWKALKRNVNEVKQVLEGRVEAGAFRRPRRNHLLLRPIGQRAFAGATGVLVERGASVSQAVKRLGQVDLWIHKKSWHEIMWDPVQKVMLRSHTPAETWLLREVGEAGRTTAREKKLDEIINAR